MKKIRGKNYPGDFVDYMFNVFGLEELMPDDCTIFTWSCIFGAGKAEGYRQACENY